MSKRIVGAWRARLLIGLLPVVLLAIPTGTAAQPGFTDRPITNNAFAPTGYTLHKGEFTVGIGPLAFGVTENVQVGTNILLWAIQVYNADLKVAVSKSEKRAFAVGVGFNRLALNLEDGDDDDEIDFTSVAPFGAASFGLGENTLIHLSGRVAVYTTDEDDTDIDDVEPGETSTGTSVFAGIEHGYSHRTKFVADLGYDATFEGAIVGGGVLFGWDTFRLKLGVSYFAAGDGFTFPLIGLWWRFRG
jgi:hypothetical protein